MPEIGYCQCGCGMQTNISPVTFAKNGWVRGQPYRFLRGHSSQRLRAEPPNPSGLCQCGCGGVTPISKVSRTSKGHVNGEHVRFIVGHNQQKGQKWRVLPNGCWAWFGALDTAGYGTMTVEGSTRAAHRYYFEQTHGLIPEGHQLHHTCRNRCCVNPDHLEVLAPTEHRRRHSKLDMGKAREIRRRCAAGESKRGLGRAFGVDARTIKDVVDGRTWREGA